MTKSIFFFQYLDEVLDKLSQSLIRKCLYSCAFCLSDKIIKFRILDKL